MKIKNSKSSNYAFIDSQNLNLAIRDLGWILDFKKFRIYLKDKYKVSKAFIFMGYLEKNKKLYDFLDKVGYICIFKPILEYKTGEIKGNCDAELVLHTMIELKNFDQAVIVSGDGDFYCLANYLKKQGKLYRVLVPNGERYSALLKLISDPGKNFLSFVSELRNLVEYKKRIP